MSFTLCAELAVLLMSKVVASQVFLCKKASLSCPVITTVIANLKASRSKQFTSQAWYPVVCYVRETLDAF